MLDEEDRQAVAGEFAEEPGEALGFGFVLAGGWFVEQEDRWCTGEAAGEFEHRARCRC